MRSLFLACLSFISFCVFGQSNLEKGEVALKWDPTRLIDPFNSTVQLGAEIGLNKSLTFHFDFGLNSNLYKESSFYNKSIFILHNQLRKYKRHGNFYGIDLFYVHAKDYSEYRGLYDKNKKASFDYDSATLIKNAPGLAVISGRQFIIGNFTIDMFIGGGLRLVSNKVEYKTQTVYIGTIPQSHFAWNNDRYSGTFPAGHFSLGIKFGYILNRKRK